MNSTLVPEKLLHYIWQHRLFYPTGLTTDDGQSVEVINPGMRNTDAGPDFFNAQVRIGKTLWAGNIEIHNNADDWYNHNHHADRAYDNVILHVVTQLSTRPTTTYSGNVVPQMVLTFPPSILQRFNEFDCSKDTIRCRKYLTYLQPLILHQWLDRLITERMEQRTERVTELFGEFNNDWDQTLFCMLARAMGFGVNAEPMEILAHITPVRILLKHPDPIQAEALLIGQAGLLPDDVADDKYLQQLSREYDFLRTKFTLTPMDGSVWKHLRLRPDNFPCIRLSQLAAIVAATHGNIANYFNTTDTKLLITQLSVKASEYWETHYMPGRASSKAKAKRLGKESCRLLIINAIVPYLFTYGRHYGNSDSDDTALQILQAMPIENNSRLGLWHSLGIVPRDECEAQALLHLYKEYCERHKCLACRIGWTVFGKRVDE